MCMPRRKHRRVRTSWEGCGCPEGWGKTKAGKRIPRWLAAQCSTAPAPIASKTPRKRKYVQQLFLATDDIELPTRSFRKYPSKRKLSIPMLDSRPRRKRK